MLNRLLNSCATLFFMHGKWTGLAILAMTFLQPWMALSGLICVLSAYGFARMVGYHVAFLAHEFYWFNALLVGFGVNHLLVFDSLTLLLLILSGIFTFMISAALSHALHYYFKLPVLSLPFIIVSTCIYLAQPHFSGLSLNYDSPTYLSAYLPTYLTTMSATALTPDFDYLPLWLNGFFQSLGSLAFMPFALTGFLLSLLLLFSSRILFLLALGGYLWGCTLTGLLTSSFTAALQDNNGFNYILIALALGGTFNLATFRTYLITLAAVAVSVPVMYSADVFLSVFNIPLFTLPFVFVTLLFIYVLELSAYPLRVIISKSNPEETLEHYLTTQQRFSPTPITLSLPFFGSWTVWQGFQGQWTHQGAGQYAYDFVLTDEQGRTHKNDGKLLHDYYCYQQAVLSPVRGRVIQVVNILPDHPIGSVDAVNHFGNYVLIQDVRGYFVKIAHFAFYGIDVIEGSWVEPGTYLGRCGNSGYSPQPHIHIHVQSDALFESATIPFRFLNYIIDNVYHEHGLPPEKALVTQAPPQAYYDQLTTHVLDSSYTFDILDKGRQVGEVTFTVNMANDFSLFFSCHGSRLYFGKKEGSFYCYHREGNDAYLRLFYMALSSMPLHYRQGLTWTDTLPTGIVFTGWKKMLASCINTLLPKWLTSEATYTFKTPNMITGTVRNALFNTVIETQIQLDPFNKIESIAMNEWVLKRSNTKAGPSTSSTQTITTKDTL